AADGYHNELYFFTDGDPTAGSITSAATMGTFLTSSGLGTDISTLNVEVHAFGVGGAVTATGQAILGAIDNTPSSPINITNYVDLESALLGTVSPGSTATGNVLTNDSFGADGHGPIAGIVSITVDGHVYAYNGTNITKDGGAYVPGTGTSVLSLDTALTGHLTFYFATGGGHTAGDYAYTAPASVASDQHDIFQYVIVDGDGDQTSA